MLLHGGDGLFYRHAIEEAGVYHDARVVLEDKGLLGDVAAPDHLHDGQAEGRGEVPVPLVVARHAHDDAGAVAHEDVVGDEEGDALAVGGVHGLDTLEADASFLLVQFAPLKVGFSRGLRLVGGYLVPVLNLALPLLQIGVLRGNDHVGHAEEGVAPGGVDRQLVAVGGGEVHLRALGPADPVALLDFDPVDEIHVLQIVDEPVGVLGDGQHPLGFLLADDLAAAALADALHHFLVGQDDLAAGAPVHGHGGLIGQALLEHLEEDPLSPLVVVRVRGVDLPVPVEGVAQHLKLLAEVGDVVMGDLGGVDVVFHGVVFRGQAEGVVADGEEDVIALHPLLPADDVHGGEGPGVAHMEALAGGVGELDEAEEFFLTSVAVDGGEGFFFQPFGLPFLFYGGEIVFHV